MNYSKKNMGTLLNMQGINEALTALAIDGDELVYGNRRVNVSKFDIELLMGDSLPFESQLTTLTPEDVFKIMAEMFSSNNHNKMMKLGKKLKNNNIEIKDLNTKLIVYNNGTRIIVPTIGKGINRKYLFGNSKV